MHFGAHLGKALRDCFDCGLTNETTQKCLLSENELEVLILHMVQNPLSRMSESYKVHKCYIGNIHKLTPAHGMAKEWCKCGQNIITCLPSIPTKVTNTTVVVKYVGQLKQKCSKHQHQAPMNAGNPHQYSTPFSFKFAINGLTNLCENQVKLISCFSFTILTDYPDVISLILNSSVTDVEWVAQIVSILNSDSKSLRICGDFKVMVIKVSKFHHYPIPKIKDLYSILTHGKLVKLAWARLISICC